MPCSLYMPSFPGRQIFCLVHTAGVAPRKGFGSFGAHPTVDGEDPSSRMRMHGGTFIRAAHDQSSP